MKKYRKLIVCESIEYCDNKNKACHGDCKRKLEKLYEYINGLSGVALKAKLKEIGDGDISMIEKRT